MTELTALMAAILVGGLIAVNAVGGPVKGLAEHMFDRVQVGADFDAKFIKPE